MLASHALIHGHSWAAIIGCFVVGTVFVLIGLALATNFRGVTEWHVRTTFRKLRPAEQLLGRSRRWRRPPAHPVEHRIGKQIRMERRMGMAFAGVGLLTIVIGVAGVVSRLD